MSERHCKIFPDVSAVCVIAAYYDNVFLNIDLQYKELLVKKALTFYSLPQVFRVRNANMKKGCHLCIYVHLKSDSFFLFCLYLTSYIIHKCRASAHCHRAIHIHMKLFLD